MKQRPLLNLYAPDGEHPSMAGSYLTTAVVYATVFGRDPSPLMYLPDGLTADDAAFLRQVAWETVQTAQGSRRPS
jgi:hypothetical protein